MLSVLIACDSGGCAATPKNGPLASPGNSNAGRSEVSMAVGPPSTSSARVIQETPNASPVGAVTIF